MCISVVDTCYIGETGSSLRKDSAMLFVLGMLYLRFRTPRDVRRAAEDHLLAEINRQSLVFA